MKSYIFKIITDLEEWSTSPTKPFDRKDFKLNSYVGIVAGIISKEDTDVLVSFNDFINLLLTNDDSLDDIKGLTLALACCEVTNKGDLGKVICEGLAVDKGKVISRSGEKFNLARSDSGYCYWTTSSNNISYCNLEYVLSVILFSSVLYRNFIDTLLMLLFKSFIFSDSDLIKIKTRFDVIRNRVEIYRKRTVH